MASSDASDIKKRVRILAGPNGSGKSTVYKALTENGFNVGIFVNADDIESELKATGHINLSTYKISLDLPIFVDEYKAHTFYKKSEFSAFIIDTLTIKDNILYCSNTRYIDSYFTAFIADYLRVKMLDTVPCFTVETVMSHESKLDYIRLAQSKGYYVYLYFISTSDVEINVGRVLSREKLGGHGVSEDKIRKRYTASLGLLSDALKLSYRAYVFDNSETKYELCVEYGNSEITVCQDEIPIWVDDYLLKRIISVDE